MILVDADACPNTIKDVVFRASARLQLPVLLVANTWVKTPASRLVTALRVGGGLDAADDAIVDRCAAGDLVITADIPLAARVLEKGAAALNPRGELYDADSIAQKLSMRNFMDELRGAGIQTGGPPPLHPRDIQAFANALDRWLAKRPPPPADAGRSR